MPITTPKAPEINSTNKARMSSKTKNGAYKILAAQKDAVTRIAGVIMLEAIDNLEDELGGIFTILKSTHFTEGQPYGYLACVIPEENTDL